MNVSGVILFIFCHFGLMTSGYGDGLLQLVNDLEQGIGAQSTVYYDLVGSSLLDDLLKRAVPSILIREETDFELRKNFNSQILSIVFIGTEFDDRVFSTLRKTLHGLHRTDVLFVTDTLGPGNWTWLFDWCWTHGFSNVLLSSQHFAPHLLTLYRFHSQQLRTTTLSEYFELRNKWRDFKGYEVRLLVGHDPPYGIVYESSIDNQKSVVSGGIYYQMVKLFAERHNASLLTIFSPNNISFSVLDCIEYFETKRADFCTARGFYDEQLQLRRHSVAVVHAVTHLRVMVPFGKRLATYEYYILPFKTGVWVALLLEVCCIAMATSFFYWRWVGSCDLSGSLLLAFKGMLHLGYEVKLACRAKLLIYLIVLCSGFIFTNLYLAKLSSFLSTNVYETELDTLDDLKARGVDILIDPVIEELFDTYDLKKAVHRYTKVVDTDTYNSYFYNLNSKHGYICDEKECIFLMFQQRGMSRPNLRLMAEVISSLGISIPIVHECPFEEAFNEFFLRVLSAGLYDVISLRTTDEAVRKGILKSFQTEQENQAKPLTLEDLQVLLLILAIGYSAAIFTFCVENLIFCLASVKSGVKIGNSKKSLPK